MDLMAALQASIELYKPNTEEEAPKQKRRKKLKHVVEETA
jgi:hypothetical protein